MPKQKKLKVAYFSMEFALDARIPNYAGGLGVLATDILNSCADKEVPAVGVSLIYHQHDDPKETFEIEKYMKKLPQTIEVEIEDRKVKVGVYQYDLTSQSGKKLPIYCLSTYLPENTRHDRDLTRNLYASDQYTRIGQEAILGIGGVRMLRELGYKDIEYFHMNEGHSSLLTFECLNENNHKDEAVKNICSFTTHTPIPAGHDYFDYELVHKILGNNVPWHVKDIGTKERLSMTHLALNLSHKTNSVSAQHQVVCEEMFPGYKIDNITNGIHHPTWIAPHMAKLFNKYLEGWNENPEVFKKAVDLLPAKDVKIAHAKSKKTLIKFINTNTHYFAYGKNMQEDDLFDEKTLTIGFARRLVSYKRHDLIFKKIDELRNLGYKKIQLIFAGKCHPDDFHGRMLKERLERFAERLRGQIKVAVIPDYNIDNAKLLVSGCDVWLNNPIKPREASGTSGMKVALNGGLNLSLLDGWWIEGFAQAPLAGWGFGAQSETYDEHIRDEIDASELYHQLEDVIDCYYNHPGEWTERMKHAISLISVFNTHRCVDQYCSKMWSKG